MSLFRAFSAWRPTAAFLVLAGVLGAGASVGAASASAASAAQPGWEANSSVYPTNLPPGGDGIVAIEVYNTGAALSSGSVTVTDTLPAGVEATAASGVGYNGLESKEFEEYGEWPYYPFDGPRWTCSIVTAATSVVTCKSNPLFLPTIPAALKYSRGGEDENAVKLGVEVHVAPGVEGAFSNRVTVTGGGASDAASASDPLTVSSSPTGFGFAGWDVWFTNADGTLDTQAGSHPYEAIFNLELNATAADIATGGHVRNLEVELPSGLFGEPAAVPQCTRLQLDAQECPPETQIGLLEATLSGNPPLGFRPTALPLYNMVPPPGVPDEFAFSIEGIHSFFDAGVHSGHGDHIVVHIVNIPQGLAAVSLILWGTPAAASHNEQRDDPAHDGPGGSQSCLYGCAVAIEPKPFLTLPTSCGAPQPIKIRALGTWEDEGATAETSVLTHDNSDTPTGFTGCEHLSFGTLLSVEPDTSAADTPAGLTADVKIPQEQLRNTEALVTLTLKNAQVTLPEGLVLNPGRATGLQACSPAPAALEGEGPVSCPAGSQVGTAQISTPLLPDRLEGAVYLLESEPPDVKLLVTAFADGVYIKVVGDVRLNPVTGQLTTTFEEAPAFPFTDFKLSFSGGAQAALVTPTRCGTITSTSDFTPWASPFSGRVPVERVRDHGGRRRRAVSVQPVAVHPQLIAGATTDQAGGFTNFSLLLQRGDDQQRIDGLQFKAPEGLTGFLADVPLCTNAQAEANTCPAASKIGHTVVESGPGPVPAGRARSRPGTGADLPHRILRWRAVRPVDRRAVARRPVHPGNAAGAGEDRSQPDDLGAHGHDQRTAAGRGGRPDRSARGRRGDRTARIHGQPDELRPPGILGYREWHAPAGRGRCGRDRGDLQPLPGRRLPSLEFAPKFRVATPSRITSTTTARASSRRCPTRTCRRARTPTSLRSKSNCPRPAVASDDAAEGLPGEGLRSQPGGLPAGIVHRPRGRPHAAAAGPVGRPGDLRLARWRSVPVADLVLQGDGVTVDLVGTTFISHAGITSTTFKTVPDDPFSTFELTLPEGKYSALASNTDVCKPTTKETVKKKVTVKRHGKSVKVTKKVSENVAAPLEMPTEIIGQNGAEIHETTKIAVTGCKAAAVKKATKKTKKKGKKKQGKK